MSESKIKESLRQHYYMAVGEIVFGSTDPELKDAPPASVRVNCIVMSVDGRLGVTHLARAQQTLQMQFHQKFGVEAAKAVNVLDVVILGLIPLGLHTHEEFNRLPEGVKGIEEVQAPSSSPSMADIFSS